jgi:hypothetical protein
MKEKEPLLITKPNTFYIGMYLLIVHPAASER